MDNGSDKICIHPIYAKSILLEHDYSENQHNDNNNNSTNESKETLEKKFHGAFDAVDKWADSVILRVPTGDDKKKIVDREITIHKVKYPFLPEQQIRGKVYKKFGIPTVMGGVLSRSLSLLGGSSPKDRPKSRTRKTKRIMDSRKPVASQELSIKEEKLYIAESAEQSYFSKKNEKSDDVKLDLVGMYGESIGLAIDLESRRCAASNNEFFNSKISQNPLPKYETWNENHSPNDDLSNYSQIVSPLQLDELSINCESSVSITPRCESRNSHRIRIPMSSEEPSTNLELQKTLIFDDRANVSQIQAPASPDKVSIHSQLTQIFIPTLVEDKNRRINKATTFPRVPEVRMRTATNFQFSKISRDQNPDEIPTQIYETSPSKAAAPRNENKSFSYEGAKHAEKSRGRKRKIEETVTKSSCKLIESLLGNLSGISIGTNPPEVHDLNFPYPDIVNHDHSYSGEEKKKSQLFAKKRENLKNKETKTIRMNEEDDAANKENKFDIMYSAPEKRERKALRENNSSSNDNIDRSPTFASPVRKKIRRYRSSIVAISPDRTILKIEDTQKFARDIDATNNLEIVKSQAIDLGPGDYGGKIFLANCIPLQAHVPLFVVVDSLSNRCCEYDFDEAKRSRLWADKFHKRETRCLDNDDSGIFEEKSEEEFEITETAKKIVEFLDHDLMDEL